MIIGILGKGGSGKSTIAAQLALYFSFKQKNVLGIDADYNMDFVFNVFGSELPLDMEYFGMSKEDMKSYLGINLDAKYADAVLAMSEQQFNFSKGLIDDFTKKYMVQVSAHLSMLVCGPENDDILYGASCGHALSAPLKLYLPLLAVGGESIVILDEKAGADGANSGIISGCDCVLIVTDPSLHGTKTALQIAKLADFFGTPYYFVANKVETNEDTEYIKTQLQVGHAYVFENDKSISKLPGMISSENTEFFARVEAEILGNGNNTARFERSKKKFLMEHEFQK